MSDSAPSNAVTRLSTRPVQGRDWVTQHWDEFVAMHAPDVEFARRADV